MTSPKPVMAVRKNYLLLAKSSVGSKLFRKLYYDVRGKRIEVLRDGDLSCAFFVSGVLAIFGLIGSLHTTVTATIADLKRHGWRPITKPREGAIIVWAPKKFKSGETHRHVGFYLGGGKVVSNSSKKRSPKIHAWDYRPIETILWNPKIK